MSLFPSQWDDFETLFDKLVTDRYGPATNSSKSNGNDSNSNSVIPQGSSFVKKVMRPKMDIVETDEAFIMTTEFPGAKKEDISIDLQNGRLTVCSETKSSDEHQKGNVRVSERSFGTFCRTVAVPQSITHDQIKAAFNEGVLELKVPKVKTNIESHRIPIA
ncbi:HSP20-like chaperone [Melampsora americana]|nr:HSP20-like chaperone [Melampsora americana]